MGILLSIPSLLCCACQTISCACTFASCCFQANLGVNYTAAKLFYVAILGFSAALASTLKYTAHSWSHHLGPFKASFKCTDSSEPEPPTTPPQQTTYFDQYMDKFNPENMYYYSTSAVAYCAGDAAVYRIGITLAIFFSVMAFVGTMNEGTFKGFWGIKLLAFGAGMLACFFLPEEVFSNGVYLGVSRFASSLFLILQILILIDFAYEWNEQWVAKAYRDAISDYDEPQEKGWLIAIIGSSFLLYIGSVTAIVMLFIYYGNTCSDSQAIISITLILSVAATVITLFRNQIVGSEGAILPGAVVTVYAIYLTWTGLQANPNGDCRPSGTHDASSISTGMLIAALSLMWTSFRATAQTQNLLRGDNTAKAESNEGGASSAVNMTTPLYRVEEGTASKNVTSLESGGTLQAGDDAPPVDTMEENVPLFFFLLVSASLYMTMMFTNWGEGSVSQEDDGQTGYASMWVKVSSAWVAILLYIWTLIAPAVCKDREFD